MSSPLHIVCPHCRGLNRVPGEKLDRGPRCGRCKQPLFTARPLELTSATFDKVAGRGDLPVVVDFWAPWCAPCRAMAPAYEQAAAQLEPRVRLAKVDTEAEPGLAARFGIQAIPTLVMLRGGSELARQPGAMDLEKLLAWVRARV